MTLDIILPGTFDNPVGLPKVKHGTGVPGWGYRWLGEAIAAVDGGTVAQWTDQSAEGVVLAGGTAAPIAATVDGNKVVRLPGTNQYLRNAADILEAPQRSWGMVFRIAPGAAIATNVGVVAVSDPSVSGGATDSSLKYTSTDGLLFDALGSTAGHTVTSPVDRGEWLVVAYTQSPDQTMRCMVNGVVSGPAITNPPSVNTFDQIYLGLAGGPYMNGDIAEFVTWPFGLTPLQMSAFYDAMRTRYSAFGIGD